MTFKYSEKAEHRALAEIDLHIKSGETLGIMGGTGSAKTSLVNLISRLYDVSEGSVEVGGIDVRDYDLEFLRNNVAVVLQKNVLFSGTIKENLRWGKADATDDEIREVCELAQAAEFVEGFPKKYDTPTSSKVVQTYPVVRSSVFVLLAPFSSTPKYSFSMTLPLQ